MTQFIATLMAMIYLCASIGVFPTPGLLVSLFNQAVVGSERFPCEGHACGCATASECWSNCCCHTPHQRLVWAIAHGVKPPTSVKFTDEQWIAAANDVTPGSAECSLCVGAVQSKLDRGITTEPACGESDSSCCSQPPEPGVRLSMSALACKGIKQILAMSLPPAFQPRVSEWLALPARAMSEPLPVEAMPLSQTLDAPVPPPRLA